MGASQSPLHLRGCGAFGKNETEVAIALRQRYQLVALTNRYLHVRDAGHALGCSNTFDAPQNTATWNRNHQYAGRIPATGFREINAHGLSDNQVFQPIPRAKVQQPRALPTDGAGCDLDHPNIATINAIRAGIGIGPLHIGMAKLWPDVIQVLPDIPVPSLEIWLACHADVRHNKRIRMVMDFLAGRMKSPYSSLHR